MIFTVFGGDERSLRLCRLLRNDGHEVRPFALENAGGCFDDAVHAAFGAKCAILPLPCCRDGWLNAPFSGEKHVMAEILAALPEGTAVCAGKASEISGLCAVLKLPLHDYFKREDFAVKNAALTAEGALALMLGKTDGSLLGSRVLLSGFGRIGKLLALKLGALGARVTIAARNPADLAWAECLGFEGMSHAKAVAGGGWDFVVNTVPAPVFGEAEISSFGGAVCIELSSPPYGFDLEAAKALGKEIFLASGLPGKVAPEAAAAVVRDTIYKILEEYH